MWNRSYLLLFLVERDGSVDSLFDMSEYINSDDVLDPKVKNQSESTTEDQSSATNAVFENPVDSTTDFPDELASLVTDNSYGQASTSQVNIAVMRIKILPNCECEKRQMRLLSFHF